MSFKSVITVLFLLFIFCTATAQLGTTHYVPPLHTRVGITNATLYLSTPQGDAANPVIVTITTGDGQVLATREIWSGSPADYRINTTANSPILVQENQLNTAVKNKGIIARASDVIYTSLRAYAPNHAGYLTTKGEDALGRRFRLGSARLFNDNPSHNFFASIIATEDNTTIAFSEYDTAVEFRNGLNPTTVLDAGESFVVSGYSGPQANSEGFIGALLEADKPIVVNSGNLNGNFYQGEFGESLSDMLIDQIVDESATGFEYMLIRGGGNDSSEVPVIIANSDDTEIYVNGSYVTTLENAGDFYYLESPSYYLPASSAQHRNMYISTNDPAKTLYVYQMLAGRSGTNNAQTGNYPSATPGMNFIPPLSCFFQNTVDLIPAITEIYPNNPQQFVGDILITSRVGTSISINGNSLDQASALSNPGTVDWETYYVDGLTGNAQIIADGPIAAGLFGAYQSAGFAGYYSGFAVNPEDTTTSICRDGGPINLLERINGNPPLGGTWTPPLASGTNIFDPNLDLSSQYLYEVAGICTDVSVTITINLRDAPIAYTASDIETCPNPTPIGMIPNQNTAEVNLRDRDTEILNGVEDARVIYYNTFDDANNDTNRIASPENYTTTDTIKTIYARVYDSLADCASVTITEFSVILYPTPYTSLPVENDILCVNYETGITEAPVVLDGTVNNMLPDATYSYIWSKDGNEIGQNATIAITTGGTYQLEVTATYPNEIVCRYSTETTYEITSNPLFELRTTEGSFASTGLYTIEIINIIGANPNTNYEWSLNGGAFQLDTLFNNVPPGDHIVVGRPVTQHCSQTVQEIEIIDYPRFFTPNNDGINDNWNIINLDKAPNLDAKIFIFDRFGKLLKQIRSTDVGWNGMFQGKPMPSNDYWFRVEFIDTNRDGTARVVNGHFTLKR